MSNETTVTSLSATRHYGTEILGPYSKTRDKGRITIETIDGIVKTKKASTFAVTYLALLTGKQMLWYIHRGDDLSQNMRVPFTLHGLYSQHEYETGNLWLSGQLYETQEEYVNSLP
jgi:hypothetical protein